MMEKWLDVDDRHNKVVVLLLDVLGATTVLGART